MNEQDEKQAQIKDDELYDELYEADPKCEHEVKPAAGGGVKCTRCTGWFCF